MSYKKDVRIKAEQVNAEIYRGEVAEREHVFQYTIENTGDTSNSRIGALNKVMKMKLRSSRNL